MDLVDFLFAKIIVPSLPSDKIPHDDEASCTKRQSRAPVDERVSEKEVLDDAVIPATHTKTNVENRPLPPVGSKIVLLIGVGNQGVVRSHHGDIQVNKVMEERRPVDSRVAGRDWRAN